MAHILFIIMGVVLALHGLVHLLGFASYWQLAQIEGLPYKTTVLAGQLNLGAAGIRVFGALWLVAAVAFVVTAVAMIGQFSWWRDLLLLATIFSFGLTLLDWQVAKAGGLVDIAILALLFLAPVAAPGLAL